MPPQPPAASPSPGTPDQQPLRPSEASETACHPGSLLPKIIPFATLARSGNEVWIENQGQLYRLRRTRQGKLILTK